KEREAALQAKADEKLNKYRVKSDKRAESLRKAHDAKLAKLEAEMTSQHEKREAKLREEIANLVTKVQASNDALELLEQQVAGEKASYMALVSATDETAAELRERISNLELAFSLPVSEDVAPVRKGGEGDPELNARVDSLYQSIIDTAREDKGLAIKQFESLPEASEKPVALLKTVANLYREKRDYDSAYSIYEALLERDPGNLYAERKLVMTLFDMGRYDDALERLAGPQERGDVQEETADGAAPNR
ncbi:MAG: tetratricopeptide repeat protein, partial [Verrucomicrobia bacterium]|nr:tetratricopeptide repeat protein [Verrucomicrobiota bacterium]